MKYFVRIGGEEHEVELRGVELLEAVQLARAEGQLVSSQPVGKQLADRLVVLDDQHPP